jgi:predicted nucleic acid-binding protein
VPSAHYLADTSAFARLQKPSVADALAPLVATGKVAVCAPVCFELGYTARTSADYRLLADRLAAFPSVPVGEGDHRRALDVQAALCEQGGHRALSLVDALVAAAAEARDLVVLHYDADFERVAGITGQPHEWVVPRGTAD